MSLAGVLWLLLLVGVAALTALVLWHVAVRLIVWLLGAGDD